MTSSLLSRHYHTMMVSEEYIIPVHVHCLYTACTLYLSISLIIAHHQTASCIGLFSFPCRHIVHADWWRQAVTLSCLPPYDLYWYCAPLPVDHTHFRSHPSCKAGIQGFLTTLVLVYSKFYFPPFSGAVFD